MILRPLFCFKDTKNTGLLIFNSLKQKKLIFNFVVNRNWKKLTDSRKRAKILADNRKRYHPIETLIYVSKGDSCCRSLSLSHFKLRWCFVIAKYGVYFSVVSSQIMSTQLTWPVSESRSGQERCTSLEPRFALTHNVIWQLWHILR